MYYCGTELSFEGGVSLGIFFTKFYPSISKISVNILLIQEHHVVILNIVAHRPVVKH
jgi:hypothetical protein